jgi:hypothetical protein
MYDGTMSLEPRSHGLGGHYRASQAFIGSFCESDIDGHRQAVGFRPDALTQTCHEVDPLDHVLPQLREKLSRSLAWDMMEWSSALNQTEKVERTDVTHSSIPLPGR